MNVRTLPPQSKSALRAIRAEHPQMVDTLLAEVGTGETSASDALTQLKGKGVDGSIDVGTIEVAAKLAHAGTLFEEAGPAFGVVTGGAEKEFAVTAGGRSEQPLWDAQFGGASVEPFSTSTPPGALSDAAKASLASTALSSTSVGGVQARRDPLKAVPGIAAIESLKAGDASPADVAAALHTALLSTNPAVRKKAATTLQVAESYARKAGQDAQNYANTGFRPLPFPKLNVRFDATQTKALVEHGVKGRDGAVVDALRMAERKGLITVEPQNALDDKRWVALSAGSGRLKGSDGQEAPRGAESFHTEWVDAVEPGMQNIREAIINTAKARGGSCPYAHGNHAKGVSFGDAKMSVDKGAPDWAKDLFGDQISGGMLRVSGSQTNPDQPDSEAHMPGIRVAFPLKGALDGSATQLIDLTANTGDTTHAQTAAEHTKFTQNISVPKGPLSGSKPIRALKHVLGGLLTGQSPLTRIKQMRNAVEVTGMANDQRFDEHVFHARHAFFVGGRYVQVKFVVVEPKPFADGRQDDRKDSRLHAVSETVAKDGMKLAMYVTEIPEGRPEMVEEEGWKGLPSFKLAEIAVPPQEASPTSAASQWFDDVGHVPGGKNKVFHAVGLGRHRVPIYEESERMRHTERTD